MLKLKLIQKHQNKNWLYWQKDCSGTAIVKNQAPNQPTVDSLCTLLVHYFVLSINSPLGPLISRYRHKNYPPLNKILLTVIQ